MNAHRLARRGIGAAALCSLALLIGCDALTEVTNPNPTIDDFRGAAEPTKVLVPGLRAGLARALNGVVITADLVSDNQDITFSSLTQDINDPHQVRADGPSFITQGAYERLQELRALADFVIDSVAPEDETATDAQLAEARYHRGMAYLMMGENFIGAPTAPDLEPTPWEGLLELARQDFDHAMTLSPGTEMELRLTAALARLHLAMGNEAEARQFAAAALAMEPDFVVYQAYYAGQIEPVFSVRVMQPLPRLDFLAPKYVSFSSPVPVGKAEGMHLILAEAAMANGDYAEGAARIAEAVRIAKARPTGQFNSLDERKHNDLTVRPRNAEILVRADADSPLRAGLVQNTPGLRTVYQVSGTSLDADSVAALTDPYEVRHALWLARQEMFFLEGRRVHDLGVRMPVTQREIDTSPAIEWGDPVTEVQVPSFIPNDYGIIDGFTPRSPYADPLRGDQLTTDEVTMLLDLNRVLAEQRVSRFGTMP